eukprot:557747-Amphidinium_carterae.2
MVEPPGGWSDPRYDTQGLATPRCATSSPATPTFTSPTSSSTPPPQPRWQHPVEATLLAVPSLVRLGALVLLVCPVRYHIMAEFMNASFHITPAQFRVRDYQTSSDVRHSHQQLAPEYLWSGSTFQLRPERP